ncbi:hypothetical protein F5Y08DRAFT_57881 [Xylaria arbuscula]|nr:hypothetical protein F5Y08DRAFT_57881 [Xylaria arbuscula]
MTAYTSSDDSSDAAPEWTREEDRLVCELKLDGNSWAEIAQVLERRSKRECQLRHRTLMSHAKELGLTIDKLVMLYINEDNDDEDDEETPRTKSKKSSKNKKKSNDSESDSDSDSDEEEPSPSKRKGKGKGKSKENKPKPTKPKSESPSKSTTTKKQKQKEVVNPPASSSSGSSPAQSNNRAQTEEEFAAEYWASRRYQCEVVYAQMYPDQKVLRPDRFYSESDCRVLSGLEARYRANKWLHIQADFCNATGRMVDAQILKAKFDE